MIVLLVLTVSPATPLICVELTNIHYKIDSSLDHAQMILYEHTQVFFCIDSLPPDSISFWRVMIEKSSEMCIDSVLINHNKLDPLIDNRHLCLFSSAEDTSEQIYHPDSLTFNLPMKYTSEGSVNIIDFYYAIKYTHNPDVSEIYVPESFTYGEYYPRLVNTPNSIYNHDQRYNSIENFSLKLQMPENLHFMSETKPHIAHLDSYTVEYSIDNLVSAHLLWLAYPKEYNLQKMIGTTQYDIYIDPDLTIDDEKLRDISNAIVFYQEQFGKLPYEKINVIFINLPENMGGGAANNFILLPNGSDSFSLMDNILGNKDEFQTTLPHETAHLWWGCAVSITDTWLSEGLASYWADQYAIMIKGQAAYNTLHFDSGRLMFRFQEMMKKDTGKSLRENISHYYKAPYILNMLALDMGSDNFTAACREFYREYRNRSPGLGEFKEIVQQHSEAPLDSFYTCWIDSNYSQNYYIENVESEKTDTLYYNFIDLGKTGKASSYVPLAVRYKDKTEASFLLNPGQLYHEWNSQCRLASVFIDPNKLILETQRFDNVWPTPIIFHSLKLSLREYMELYLSFLGDEPGYHLYLFPDFPGYSERFGWEFSAALLGKHGSMLENIYMEDIDILRIGYNTKSNSPIYRLFKSKTISSATSWKSTCNISLNGMHGKHDNGVGVKYGRTLASRPMFFPELRISASIAHRRFYTLEDVDESIWPERDTTPIRLELSLLSHVNADLEFERGFRVSGDNDTYYRHTMAIEKRKRRYSWRLFVGTSGGDAVQERFDPSHEGGMKGYPPFLYYYDHLMSVNLLLKHSLVSPINLRLFGNHINPMTGGYSASEFGFGLMMGNGVFGFIIDMPVYLGEADIDGKEWNMSRFRLQLNLFSFGNEPKWDFLAD